MRKTLYTIILFIILASGVYFVFFRVRSGPLSKPAVSTSKLSSSSELSSFSLEKTYYNSTYKFSLKIPKNFQVREIPSEESSIVLLENKKGEGIQIMISPFEDIRVLTADRIHKDLSNLKIMDPQSVEIGNGYKGLDFKSDNPAFAGASQEIWFVFHSNLYQISTYGRLTNLLKDIFATWKFKQ